MSIRAKMRLSSVVAQQWGGAQAIFNCVYDNTIPEDQKFQQATPSGMAQFSIDNPAAVEQLVIGKSYYFDITPADPPVSAVAPAHVDPAPAAADAGDNCDPAEGSNATQG